MLSEHTPNADCIVQDIKAHGKGCNGCRAVKMDIMLSMNLKSDPTDIMDVFLTTKQAEDLILNLQKQLEFNKTEV